MRHHPKSNNGVFSKKQTKASRRLMAERRGFRPKNQGGVITKLDPRGSRGFMAGILGAILGMQMRRKAS